jgi:hypothetical protein
MIMGSAVPEHRGKTTSPISPLMLRWRTSDDHRQRSQDRRAQLCWICKAEEGTTREHLTKRSDLKAVLGDRGPLYLHTATRRNRKIQSINSKTVKFSAPMCNRCNSGRTQPHDRAWELLSEALRLRKPSIKPGDIIRVDRIFHANTSQQMRNVHLFFVKWLGCQLVESNISISPGIDTLAQAIMKGKSHPNIWLAFGVSDWRGVVQTSDVDVAAFGSRTGYDYVCRIYHVDALEIRVRFSAVKLKPDWHPSQSNRFIIAATPQWL